uniref:Uncharacterized protein n=1 Tax=Pelodiscus sinensis respiratory and hemorrhagic syndrome virus TaxID=2867482 RepID=A0A8G0YJU3_9NIDO|nr:hypothetical protein [Pelodiscus sinensis respiratory and hemorrhagic syndrome virus]
MTQPNNQTQFINGSFFSFSIGPGLADWWFIFNEAVSFISLVIMFCFLLQHHFPRLVVTRKLIAMFVMAMTCKLGLEAHDDFTEMRFTKFHIVTLFVTLICIALLCGYIFISLRSIHWLVMNWKYAGFKGLLYKYWVFSDQKWKPLTEPLYIIKEGNERWINGVKLTAASKLMCNNKNIPLKTEPACLQKVQIS